jgi:hypothetical protein
LAGNLTDFENWKQSNNITGWNIKYYKGLGTSTAKEASEYFSDLNGHTYFIMNKSSEKKNPSLELAFSKKFIPERKKWLEKYDPSKIWIYSFMTSNYKKYGYSDAQINDINYLYHPKIKKVFNTNLDTHVTDMFKRLDVTGFFATDYGGAYKSGGEIMLAVPNLYLKLYKYSKIPCFDKNVLKANLSRNTKKTKLKTNKMSRLEINNLKTNNKHAYIMLLMGNSMYFYGALVTGFSLKNIKINSDTIIMVTPDVPDYQKKNVKKYL